MTIIAEDCLIAATQAAITCRNLGYHHHHLEPRLVYADGSLCPLGAALPKQVVRQIEKDGWVQCDWLDLMRTGYFAIQSLRVVEALTTLQCGYDMCFDPDFSIQSQRRVEFEAYALSLNPKEPPETWPSEISSLLMFTN